MKSVILFSGGPDSLAALEVARQETEVVGLVYFQKDPLSSSQRAAWGLSRHYNISLLIIDYPLVLPRTYSSSLGTDSPYLPDRNLFFLSLVSIWSKHGHFGKEVARIYAGFCQGDPRIYDITSNFVSSLNVVLAQDSEYQIEIYAPYADKPKVTLLSDLLYKFCSPVHLTWSCFKENNWEDIACGTCAACVRRIAAFRGLQVRDPVKYKVQADWTGCLSWEEYYEASKKTKGVKDGH